MARPDLKKLMNQVAGGEAASAAAACREAIKNEPGHVACYVVLAHAEEANGRLDGAVEAWRSAYALVPDSPVIRDGLRRASAEVAVAFARQTRSSRAAAVAEKSLKDDEPYHEIDDLIKDLEGARIVPDPEAKPVDPTQLEPDVEDVVSETLANIYTNQRFFEEAARVYEKLAVQQPGRKEEFLEKAEELRKKVSK